MKDLTFLFTDVEGSTQLWENHENDMRLAVRRHDELAQEVMARHDGNLVKERGEGDSLFVVFPHPLAAIRACIDLMAAFEGESWPGDLKIVTRAAIHTGPAELRDHDYYGPTINRCARLRGVANGKQILLSQAAAGLILGVPHGDFELRDLGEHQLKDLSRKELIYLVETERYSVNETPIRSMNLHPHNLPIMMSRYVARESVSKALRDMVVREGRRLVTILGLSGVGKTRAAIQLGADIADRFPGGVWVIPCDELRTQEQLLTRIADQISLDEVGGGDLIEELLNAFRANPTCLILDGAEKLINADPEVGTLIESLISGPKTQVVVTSLSPLGVTGEQTYSLKPLDLPTSADISISPSEELFLEYARARNAHFSYGPKNAAAIREICTIYDGLPLALELVASLISAMTPAEIVEELHELGGMGALDAEVGANGKTNLRSALEWSYSLLSPDEQEVFERLSVFAIWFGREAAGEVLAHEALSTRQIRPVLRRLVEKSLIQAMEGDDGTTRYRMIGSVREFATSKLKQKGDDHDLYRKHLRYYAEFVRERDLGAPGADRMSLLTEITREMDNNVAAWRWGMNQKADPSAETDVLILAGGMSLVFYYCGRVVLGREVLNTTVKTFDLDSAASRAALPSDDARFWSARSLNGQGLLAMRAAKYDEAEERFLITMDAWTEINDPVGRSAVLSNVGLIKFYTRKFDEALALHEEALEIRKPLGRADLLANSYNNLSITLSDLGDHAKARQMMEEATLARKRMNDTLGMAECMHNIARLHRLDGDFAAALHASTNAFKLIESLGPTSTSVMIDDLRSHLLLEADTPRNAARVAETALGVAESFEMPETVGNLRATLAIALWLDGQQERARDVFGEAVIEANSLGPNGPRDRLAIAGDRFGINTFTLIPPEPEELTVAEKYWDMSPSLGKQTK